MTGTGGRDGHGRRDSVDAVTTWFLLLRAVNLGPRNKLAMADLRSLLTDLGHADVKTFLNSGNASFTSRRSARERLAGEIEDGLRERLGLSIRMTLRTGPELATALAGLPVDIAASSYVLLAFLLGRPVSTIDDWDVAPERLAMGDGVVYIGYAGDLRTSKLTNAALDKRLGVATTARTPDTVRKLLGAAVT